jgi:hypothetical protein
MEPTTLQFTPSAMLSGGPPGFTTPHDRHPPRPPRLQPQPGTQFAPSGPSTAFIHTVRNFGPASVHSTNVPGIPGPAPSTFQPQMYYAPAGSPILSGQHPPVHTVPQHQSASFSFAPTVRDMHFGHAPAGSANLSGGGPGPPHGTSQYSPVLFPPVSQNFVPHHSPPSVHGTIRNVARAAISWRTFWLRIRISRAESSTPRLSEEFWSTTFLSPHANCTTQAVRICRALC